MVVAVTQAIHPISIVKADISLEIPHYIFELYKIAQRSYIRYKQGELVQSREMAYELRDLADHLITASQKSDSKEAERDFQQAAEHIVHLSIEPLQRRVQDRVIWIDELLMHYQCHRWLHDLPDQYLVEQALEDIATELEEAQRSKGRTDPAEANEAYKHIERAYTQSLTLERTLKASLRALAFRVELWFWLVTLLIALISLVLAIVK